MISLSDLPNIVEGGFVRLALSKSTPPAKAASNRSYEIGHPCDHYLFLRRVAGDQSRPVGGSLAGIFYTGRLIHELTYKSLMDVGAETGLFDVVAREVPFSWDNYKITGHIDGMFVDRDTRTVICPFDIKSVGQKFDQLNSIEDLMAWRYSRLWVDQGTSYMMLTNEDKFAIVLVRKNNLMDVKVIPFELDWERGEQIVKRAERVNAAVEGGAKTKKINDPELCLDCPLAHVCLPEITIAAGPVVDSEEAVVAAGRMEELRPAYTEYNACKRTVDAAIRPVLGVADSGCVGASKPISLGPYVKFFKGTKRHEAARDERDIFYWREVNNQE